MIYPDATLSHKEYLKLHGTLPSERIVDLVEEIDSLNEQIEKDRRYYESVIEQLHFGQDVVEMIQEHVNNTSITKIKDLRQAIKLVIEESYFEI